MALLIHGAGQVILGGGEHHRHVVGVKCGGLLFSGGIDAARAAGGHRHGGRKELGCPFDGFHGGCATHGVTRGVYAGGIQRGIGLQDVFHQRGQGLAVDIKGRRAHHRAAGHVSGIAGSNQRDAFLASQGNQAQLVHGLHGVVSATMIAQD